MPVKEDVRFSVGRSWTWDERQFISSLVEVDLRVLSLEEQAWIENEQVKPHHPAYKKNLELQGRLEHLLFMLHHADSRDLEGKRYFFYEYVRN